MKHCEIQLHIVEIDEERNTTVHKWSSRLLEKENEPIRFPAVKHAKLIAQFMLEQGKLGYLMAPQPPAEPKPPTQTTPAQLPQTSDP